MTRTSTEAPAKAWKDIVYLAILGTTGSLLVSLALNYLLLFSDALTPFGRGVITATVLPLVICLPLFVFIGLKLADIRHYRRELNKAASYDGLTGCLNGTVFASLIERRAVKPSAPGSRSGAFLVIHPEHLRAINLRFGLGWGDEALRLIASAIRSSVRSEDVIGRIGASMFGVFLPGASEADARKIGERIRAGVSQVYFAPQGGEEVLAVKLGGVVFEQELEFEDMFRSAAERLSGPRSDGGFDLSHRHA
ncbi:GGDEF domain-containing protein [Mesorhizobium sp. B2-3-3]|uniref:GGDEF domain-containing protein n=1 Tax=unclassified Mesorhizobium TaxID=325217 RepID=UPI00112E0CCD|nr:MULTISPECIES: GGDEF domain-containing protein [unclassified Mesorhizobium]TPK63135.1 GGDEF domain-containing protein [Mesorhizobium sp. B2-4-15]TPM26054.1 GGDEF domain-containing protein [Mesorhizobium sp. B2-3-5]TPN17871.1 GGDEF domain-containing protein [Mesorhizobium sp. B2-3-3]